jgi:hypothetical protein
MTQIILITNGLKAITTGMYVPNIFPPFLSSKNIKLFLIITEQLRQTIWIININ